MATLVLVVVASAALCLLWVRWMEPRMLFYPLRDIETTPASRGWRFEETRLTAADGTRLHGWFVPASDEPAGGAATRRLTVLFLHGNAGNVSHRLDKLAILRDLGVDVLILDYRGYGESEGRPDEAGMHHDARAGYEHLTRARGIDPRTIVLHGESLGSAVAAHVASQADVGGVVLEAAFTSVPEAAPGLFRLLPLRWMVRNRFDTLGRIGRVRAPVLILQSRDDEYFPFRHAERLESAAREAVVVELRGGHNDAFLVSAPTYRRALAGFFAKLAGS